MKQDYKIRQALISDEKNAVPGIYSAGPDIIDWLFKTKTHSGLDFVRYSFKTNLGHFSHKNHMAVELDGEAVGFASSYSRLQDFAVIVGSAINILKFYSLREIPSVLVKSCYFELLRKKYSNKSEYCCNLSVLESFRGKKIAYSIFVLLIERARKKGKHRLVLDVSSENIKARGLYGYWGFSATGLRKFPLTSIKPHYQMSIDITNYPA